MKDTADLRTELTAMFRELRAGTMEKEQAKTGVVILRTIIDTAKLDLSFAKLTNSKSVRPMAFSGPAIEHEAAPAQVAKPARRLRAA